jgi:hypothetical protein
MMRPTYFTRGEPLAPLLGLALLVAACFLVLAGEG